MCENKLVVIAGKIDYVFPLSYSCWNSQNLCYVLHSILYIWYNLFTWGVLNKIFKGKLRAEV